jgi:hypothetical protein
VLCPELRDKFIGASGTSKTQLTVISRTSESGYEVYPKLPSLVAMWYPDLPSLAQWRRKLLSLDEWCPKPPSLDEWCPKLPSLNEWFPKLSSLDQWCPKLPSLAWWFLSNFRVWRSGVSQTFKSGSLMYPILPSQAQWRRKLSSLD